jgi:Tol biopolymer transport system component
MVSPLGSSPVTAVRRLRAVFIAAAVALAAFDALLLTGTIAPWSATSRSGCGQQTAMARPQASASAPPRAGLVWLPLGGRPTTLVATDPRRIDHPAVSPNGRQIAFLSRSNGIVARLEVCDLGRHTTRTVPMAVPAGNFALSWERNGKALVFLGGDLSGWGADQRLFVVDPSGRGLRQLSGNTAWYIDGAAPSPDGTKLALLLQWRYPQGREPEQLAVLDLGTGRLERVAGSKQVAEIDALSWSPDGRQIVLSAYRQNPHGGLYVVELATRRLRPLLVHGAGARSPAWSPNGSSIAFVRGGAASSSIWLLDLRSGVTRRLTHGGVDVAPAWAPNGEALVFVRRRLTS